jgi:desulfoferrodoxin-like iron-binding protein
LNFAGCVRTVKTNRGKGGGIMAVKKTGEKYRCNICGNEVIVTKVGGGTLVCCGKDMGKIKG